MQEHGGRIREASQRFGIPLTDWLDLSTGINPRSCPVGGWEPVHCQRLPEEEDGLEAAAAAYYGVADPLPVAGSQAAIQALPGLFPAGRQVGIAGPVYAEHARAWRRAGHAVSVDALQTLAAPGLKWDVLVVVNPNNPDGRRWPASRLLDLHGDLSARGGTLVVDEAFMDAEPGESLLPFCPRPGLVVLRSLGKFFGLAGIRVGFVMASTEMRAALGEALGPWTLAGPSRVMAQQALWQRTWQEDMRGRLPADSARLARLLAACGLAPAGGTALFQWVPTPRARDWQEALARRGIWVRAFDEPVGLRFGLPGEDTHWQRLEEGLRR